MQIRWSPDAAADFQNIVDHFRDDPAVARRVGQMIYEYLAGLGTPPLRGKHGRVEHTRELVLPPLPLIVVYRVRETAGVVEIVNLIHGTERWPPAG
jgi:toxin ParE1/3/4